MTASAASLPDGLAAPRRYWAALAVSLAVTVSVLDGAMIHVAAPVIARDLHVPPSTAIWIVSAYQLASAVALLPIGKLADVLGRKRVYISCLCVFVVGACVSAAAPTLATLAAARFLQGLGGAGILGVTNAVMRDIYPRERLSRGLALNTFVVAIALASGPMIASLLLAFASWRMLFLVAIPIGALLLILGAQTLPLSRPTGERVDFISFPLSALFFGALLMSVNLLAHGESGLVSAALLALSLVSLAAVLARQRGSAAPLLPTDLLRIRPYGVAVATLFASSSAQLIGYVATPFLLQRDGARPLLESGFIFTCWPLAVAVGAPIAGRLAPVIAPRLICSIGLAIFAAGLTALAFAPAHATMLDLGWRMAVCGGGYGLFQPPNAASLVTTVPAARAASASSLAACGRVMGQACGAALAAFLFRWDAYHGIAAALAAAACAAALAAVLSSLREA